MAGANLSPLLSRLTLPTVRTLHTVLAEPTAEPRAVLDAVTEASVRGIVIAGDWRSDTRRVLAWFLGDNDLTTPLVDVASGSCRDSLNPDRANETRGGGSMVSWLLSLADLRRAERPAGAPETAP